MEISQGSGTPAPDDDEVPVFGTWRRIYVAVLVCAVGWIAFVAVFSRWPF